MRLFRSAALTLMVIGLALWAPMGAADAQSLSLTAIEEGARLAEREAQTIRDAAERLRLANTEIAAEIGTAADGTEPPTLNELRQAQFEVDISRTRLVSLDNRIASQAREIEAIRETIIETSTDAGNRSTTTLDAVVTEAALALLNRQREAAEEVSRQLAAIRLVIEDALSWRREQLAVLQRESRLSALVAGRSATEEAIVARLRELVDRLTEDALLRAGEADAIRDTNPGAVAERNALRVEADEATLRASARSTDVSIVAARSLVRSIAPLTHEKAVPVRILTDAVTALDEASVSLDQRVVVSRTISAALSDLGQILAGTAFGPELSERLTRLDSLLATQLSEIDGLRETILSTREGLVRERSARERSVLFQRERARTDQEGRARIAAELAELPGELGALYRVRRTEVETAIAVAPPRQFAIFGAAVLLILGLTVWLRQRALVRFVKAEATQATEIPLEVLRRNLLWLLPVAVWLMFCELFGISRPAMLFVGTLLVIPPAAALLQDLTHVIVTRAGTGATGIGKVITRATAVALLLTAGVGFAYVVLAEVPLLPSTQLAINRLAYSVFVLGGLPMLLFVLFFAKSTSGERARPLRSIVAGLLALLPPSALIAVGVTGLAGYTHLAVILMEDLALAIVIIASLALALGILNDLVEGVALKIRARDPAQAYFVRQNFLQPAKRLGQIILATAALIVAARIFAWTADTVVVRDIIGFWRTPLFSIGESPYTVGNVLIGALAFVLVFWAAAWIRRVTYGVFLRQVKDIGIRQSLSVFAQYVVVVIGVLLTLSAIGFDVTTLTVFAASLGVGIGFGLQNVVNNFISGLLLLVERPLRLGDIVTVAGTSGTVSQIGIRSMRMRTFDEFDLIVPNSALVSETFTNWTRSNSLIRVLLTVGIGYEDPPEKAIEIVTKVLEDHPLVVRNPEPLVTVEEFGDSSVNLRVCFYGDLRGARSMFVVRSEVLTTVRQKFAEAGINIPFPQRDVHIIAQPKSPIPGSGTALPPRAVQEGDWQGDAIEMVEDAAGDGADDHH